MPTGCGTDVAVQFDEPDIVVKGAISRPSSKSGRPDTSGIAIGLGAFIVRRHIHKVGIPVATVSFMHAVPGGDDYIWPDRGGGTHPITATYIAEKELSINPTGVKCRIEDRC